MIDILNNILNLIYALVLPGSILFLSFMKICVLIYLAFIVIKKIFPTKPVNLSKYPDQVPIQDWSMPLRVLWITKSGDFRTQYVLDKNEFGCQGYGKVIYNGFKSSFIAVYAKDRRIELQIGDRYWDLSNPKLKIESGFGKFFNIFRVSVNDRIEFQKTYYGFSNDKDFDFFPWLSNLSDEPELQMKADRWGKMYCIIRINQRIARGFWRIRFTHRRSPALCFRKYLDLSYLISY